MGQILCPRCKVHYYTPYGETYSEEAPFPALSRVDDIYICNACGVHEAFVDLAGMPPIPPDQWPVELPEIEKIIT